MNKAKSRTSLVLMELIITILFFSLASAVCVQLFVRAHLTSNETKKLNEAINITQSIAEVMNGTDGSLTSVHNHYPNSVGDDDYFVIYYDENFKETTLRKFVLRRRCHNQSQVISTALMLIFCRLKTITTSFIQ